MIGRQLLPAVPLFAVRSAVVLVGIDVAPAALVTFAVALTFPLGWPRGRASSGPPWAPSRSRSSSPGRYRRRAHFVRVTPVGPLLVAVPLFALVAIGSTALGLRR